MNSLRTFVYTAMRLSRSLIWFTFIGCPANANRAVNSLLQPLNKPELETQMFQCSSITRTLNLEIHRISRLIRTCMFVISIFLIRVQFLTTSSKKINLTILYLIKDNSCFNTHLLNRQWFHLGLSPWFLFMQFIMVLASVHLYKKTNCRKTFLQICNKHWQKNTFTWSFICIYETPCLCKFNTVLELLLIGLLPTESVLGF